jgi:hypothetical protein
MRKRGVKSPDRADAVWYAAFDSISYTSGRKPGEVVAVETEEFVDSGFFHGSGGISSFGW